MLMGEDNFDPSFEFISSVMFEYHKISQFDDEEDGEAQKIQSGSS